MFSHALHIQPGITSVIGSGGKTSLLRTLGLELSRRGHRVILSTTTRIFPFPDIPCLLSPEEIRSVLDTHKLICTGTLLENGKLAPPPLSPEELASLADYVILECDGSKGLPLKAHLPHEPVIPSSSTQTICVVGLSGIGLPVSQAAHRPERFGQLASLSIHAAVSPEAVAAVLNAEALGTRYLLNQADRNPDAGLLLSSLLNRDAIPASLKQGRLFP